MTPSFCTSARFLLVLNLRATVEFALRRACLARCSKEAMARMLWNLDYSKCAILMDMRSRNNLTTPRHWAAPPKNNLNGGGTVGTNAGTGIMVSFVRAKSWQEILIQ